MRRLPFEERSFWSVARAGEREKHAGGVCVGLLSLLSSVLPQHQSSSSSFPSFLSPPLSLPLLLVSVVNNSQRIPSLSLIHPSRASVSMRGGYPTAGCSCERRRRG